MVTVEKQKKTNKKTEVTQVLRELIEDPEITIHSNEKIPRESS